VPVESIAHRSANMALIRGANTKPEMILRKALWRQGLRYRVNTRIEGLRPDIVFPARRLAVFVDGCFWHGCPLHYVRPRSASGFWAAKLAANVARDRTQTLHLLGKGWDVLRFWEHQVKDNVEELVSVVAATYRGQPSELKARPVVSKVEAVASEMELWHIEDLLEEKIGSAELRPRRAAKKS
jgi:DNA mismatch endonuclease (patch repair protein)